MAVGGVLGPVLALAAGAVSFFSPCVLPLVPVYLARLAGVSGGMAGTPVGRRTVMLHAIAFVVGLAAVFITLGASVGLIGYVLVDRVPLLLRLGGLMVIVFGLHMAGILRIPFLYRTAQVNEPAAQRAGYLSSALIGGAFALGWTPCVGPVLGSILTLAYSSGTVAHGTLLLIFYTLGLGVPFIVAGVAFGSFTRLARGVAPRLQLLETVSGFMLIAMGVLLFTNTFTRLNQFTSGFRIGGL